MRNRNAGAVEYALSIPMRTRGMAHGINLCGNLRHIDDGSNPCGYRGVREIRAGIDELRLRDGIHEVSASHPLHGFLNGVVVEEIAEDNLRSVGTQCRGTVVVVMYEGSNLSSPSQQVVDRAPTGGACRPCYQIQFITHLFLQIYRK